MDEDAFVTVAVFYSLPAAAVARSALEAQGFPTQSVGAAFASVNWHFMVAIGGIELRVPADKAGSARSLLAESDRPPLRESAAFHAAPVRNAVLFAALFLVLNLWAPFWVRRWPASEAIASNPAPHI